MNRVQTIIFATLAPALFIFAVLTAFIVYHMMFKEKKKLDKDTEPEHKEGTAEGIQEMAKAAEKAAENFDSIFNAEGDLQNNEIFSSNFTDTARATHIEKVAAKLTNANDKFVNALDKNSQPGAEPCKTMAKDARDLANQCINAINAAEGSRTGLRDIDAKGMTPKIVTAIKGVAIEFDRILNMRQASADAVDNSSEQRGVDATNTPPNVPKEIRDDPSAPGGDPLPSTSLVGATAAEDAVAKKDGEGRG